MYLIDVRYSQQEQLRQVEGQAAITGAGAKETAIEEENVFYKETPFNDFTERLSNWIHERITGDVLLDYGTVNLMQNRYELRVFLERNARRHAKEIEVMTAKYLAEGKKANGESESDEEEDENDKESSSSDDD